jgi:RNA polymerase sigma factor (sigma-70 family)
MKYSDAELLNGLVTRDEKVLREYYELYYQSIRRFVINNKGNEEDARDLFQDTLVVLYQKVRREPFKLTCTLGTYLYSVGRHLWLKELSRKKRLIHKAIDHENFMDADSDVDQISEYNERLIMYRSFFERLTADCRKVLGLFMEGHSITEITLLMGYSSDQHTRNRRYRCKTSLIKSIRARYGHEIEGYGDD